MNKRIFWAIGIGLSLLASDAFAVVGRPLTPVSYAGVARRTTRRTVHRTAAAASPAYVTTLPAGCGELVQGGVTHYNCGSVRYQAAYSGGTLVYIQQP
jgi:hypothetical protein